MPRHPVYDVAVIGAGPAGSRTAQLLASRGYSVMLLERDAEPGIPVHCTGIVSKACVEEFRLPDSLILHSVNTFVLRSPKGHKVKMHRQEVQGYILDRTSLDQYLVSEAESAGVKLVTRAQVCNIKWLGNRVSLAVKGSSNITELSARIAVVATGFGSPLSRHLGLTNVKELVSGCQAVVEMDIQEPVEVFTGDSLGPGGYGWLVPWKPGLALVGVLNRVHTVSYMHSLIRRLQEEGRIGAIQKVFRCRPIPLGTSTSSILDGILGVGDVVSQVKPTTGGGIYYGLLGANAAVNAIDNAFAEGDFTVKSLQRYDENWRAILELEIRRGYSLRKICEQLPDSVLEQLHRLLRLPIANQLLLSMVPSSFDWHTSAAFEVLKLYQRTKQFQNQLRLPKTGSGSSKPNVLMKSLGGP